MERKSKGITLIALIVTIILMLILAGVVLSLTLGESGILQKTEQASEQYKISQIIDELELEKADLLIKRNGKVPSVQEYVDYLIAKGKITPADVIDIDDNNKNIIAEGYIFLVEKEANGNIKITYQKKADNKPRIAKLQVTKTTINSISIKVIAGNADGGNYKYLIKNVTAGETSFTEVTTITKEEYTFTGLIQDNEYIIQVELITNKGEVKKETDTIKTEAPKVTSITLDKTNISMYVEDTDTITAEVLPTESLDKTLTWESSNEGVVTVDNNGTITGVGEGVAIITVTSNEVNTVTAICNITVILPPPPTAGVGGTTHTAKPITYTWDELNSVAKVISDNYGTTSEGKINNDTAEVNVSVKGKSYTLGIGDYLTLNGKKVRIMGFNHDPLTSTSAYGVGCSNTYAGISFEFAECLASTQYMAPSTSDCGGGWQNIWLRSYLNSTTYNSLANKQYIKQVQKKYMATYNNASNIKTSNDYLWLLSAAEVFSDGNYSTGRGWCQGIEGTQYKLYKIATNTYNSSNSVRHKAGVIQGSGWWLRSFQTLYYGFCTVRYGGIADAVRCDSKNWVAPGFAI